MPTVLLTVRDYLSEWGLKEAFQGRLRDLFRRCLRGGAEPASKGGARFSPLAQLWQPFPGFGIPQKAQNRP
jgi:hypothetical protein